MYWKYFFYTLAKKENIKFYSMADILPSRSKSELVGNASETHEMDFKYYDGKLQLLEYIITHYSVCNIYTKFMWLIPV